MTSSTAPDAAASTAPAAADWRTPPAELARRLGVSAEALALARASDFIDLHVDAFIWTRLFGYDLNRRHEDPPSRGFFGGHLDFPRAVDAGLTGGLWSITTNPLRTRAGRRRALADNLAALRAVVDASGGRVALVRSASEYRAARARGAHALFIAIQGGNALDPGPDVRAQLGGDDVMCVTLVHLTSSFLGRTSAPSPVGGPGLTAAGVALVEALDDARVLVDLAHLHRDGFWRAVEVHDRARPLVSTHTGVTGVTPHWRNLDDAQIRAIADSGGVVGIIFQSSFLTRKGGPRDLDMIVEHIEHTIDVGGEDAVAIGSDYDGMIIPPRELRDGLALPRLVERLLVRGHAPERVAKILGGNFVACLARVRP